MVLRSWLEGAGRAARTAYRVARKPVENRDAVRLVLAASAGGSALLLAAGEATSRRPPQCYYEKAPDGSVDRLRRWSARSWGIKAGSSPGFHLKSINPLLEKHLARFSEGLGGEEGASVLVPLCGKCVDMPFLCEQGFRVVGVEGVQRAIMELRSEHRMRLKDFRESTTLSFGEGRWYEGVSFEACPEFRGARPGFVFKTGPQGLGYYRDSPCVWRGKVRAGNSRTVPLQVLQADMFQVTPEMVKGGTFESRGMFDMVYDRSALDAVPPEARRDYVAATGRLLRQGGRMLLIVVEYDQAKVPIDPTGRRWSPPPFSVPEAEVRRLFPARDWDVQVLGKQVEDSGLVAGNPSFHGVSVHEVTYLITKKGPDYSPPSGLANGLRRYWPALLGVGVAGVLGSGCLS